MQEHSTGEVRSIQGNHTYLATLSGRPTEKEVEWKKVITQSQIRTSMPGRIEEQEVLCSNCYETIPMNSVDLHSASCIKESALQSARRSMVNYTIDEEIEYQNKCKETNERLTKLI